MTKPSKPTNFLPPLSQLAVAAFSAQLSTGNELQLLPAGVFVARDGRPKEVSGWLIDAALAKVLIAASNARVTPYVIDYEHQTLLAKDNGKPAPAAGWFKTLEWREGVGLFAIDVEWTETAQAHIAAKEYKFISPVIGYDKKTGAVTALFMAAVTNNPAIDGMDQVLLDAAALHFTFSPSTTSLTLENPMDKIIEKILESLRWTLNLPLASTPDDIAAQLQKLIDMIKQEPTAAAAASFDLAGFIATQRATVVSLSAATPDPSKYVPIEVMRALQTQLATLTAQGTSNEVDELVSAALTAGKLVPAQEAWARDLGAKDAASLKSYIAAAPSISALSGMQTQGKPPVSVTNESGLTPEQEKLCAAFGVAPTDFLKTLQIETPA